MEIKLHAFLNSELDVNEWLASRPGRFAPIKRRWYPLDRRLGGPQSRSGRGGEDKEPENRCSYNLCSGQDSIQVRPICKSTALPLHYLVEQQYFLSPYFGYALKVQDCIFICSDVSFLISW
jgi:hypothetical protein